MSANHQTTIISVEGNIGSGKSTLVEELRKMYAGTPHICFLQEPVDIWNTIKDHDGTTMLTKFYSNAQKYSFAFQMMAYISRLSLLKNALKNNYDVIVVERSMYTDKKVFAKMLYDAKNIEEVEYQIYHKWFDEFIEDIPPLKIIYVKTSPEVAHQRVQKRGREGENIPLEYLRNCHKYHEDWLDHVDEKLLIDGNTDNSINPEITSIWLEKCRAFINK
tara:strand:- start:1185 stop:1841 length:657 start_codon:yes stop_codon:yes gene_type:complete